MWGAKTLITQLEMPDLQENGIFGTTGRATSHNATFPVATAVSNVAPRLGTGRRRSTFTRLVGADQAVGECIEDQLCARL